jgi:DNA-binding transcriptional ArsR family regulator
MPVQKKENYIMKDIVRILKALSEEIRLRIINLLYQKEELCVCEIVEALSLPQSTISRHMGVLKNAGIVEDKKAGQWVFYKLLIEKEETSFIKILIENGFKKIPLLQNDIKALTKRIEKGGNVLCKEKII